VVLREVTDKASCPDTDWYFLTAAAPAEDDSARVERVSWWTG